MKPETYIAFLRAINVGGRVVKMERLRTLFSELGFGNVRTYIQSGNVFFETAETDRKGLTGRIKQHLRTALGYEATTILRTIAEVENALALDPFRETVVTPDVRLCTVFISRPLPESLELPLASPKGDFELIAATAGEVFAVARIVKGKIGNPGAFVEKRFGVKATVRFFGTTDKILRAAKASA